MSYNKLSTERRETILEGISKDRNIKEIATNIGVSRRQIIRDVWYMRKRRDPGLLKAQEKASEKLKQESNFLQNKQNRAFIELTGKTLKEKSFQNMVDFYRPELIRILKSEDRKLSISRLPKSVKRTLIKNDIIRMRGGKCLTEG